MKTQLSTVDEYNDVVAPSAYNFLSVAELFWAGITLLVYTSLICLCVIIATSTVVIDLDNKETDTEDQLITLHSNILNDQALLLFTIFLFYVSAPIGLAHSYYLQSIIDSFFAAIIDPRFETIHFINLLGRLYNILFILNILCNSLLCPMFLFLSVYYNWKFTDIDNGASYTGYYIQFAFIRVATQCSIMGYLFFSFSQSIPWILFLFRNDETVIDSFCCCYNITFHKWCFNILLIMFILLIYFCAMASVFDWAYVGFWSIDGASQSLAYFILIVTFLLGLWLIYLSKHVNSINQIITDVNTQNYDTNDFRAASK